MTCDVTSGNVLQSLVRTQVLCQQKGRDRGRWVGAPKQCKQHDCAASGFSCTKALVGTGWAISLLPWMNQLRKWSSDPVGFHFWQWHCSLGVVINLEWWLMRNH